MSSEEDSKEKIKEFFKKKQDYLQYILLTIILWFGYKVRTSNLPLLIDKVTGKYIMADPDATAFLRYTQYMVEHGSLMTNDILRYHPLGYNPTPEFSLLSQVVAKLYTFLHLFNSNITVEYTAVIYPAIAFVIGAIFFYLTIREILGTKTAILATTLLTILPAYLFRTQSGVSDKEALGIVFFFICCYFMTQTWKKKTTKSAIGWGIATGVSTWLLGLTWGGINFFFLIIGSYALFEILFDKFDKHDLLVYSSWFITYNLLFFIILPYPKFQITSMATTAIGVITLLPIIAGGIKYFIHEYDIFHLKKYTENKLPPGIFSLILASCLGAVAMSILYSPSFLIMKVQEFLNMFHNVPGSRWILTVAESHQPYMTDWFGQFTRKFIWITFAGATLLFYEVVKPIKEHKWHLTGAFAAILLMFSLSRYSDVGNLNGTSPLATLMYNGALILTIGSIVGYYGYCYKKKPEIFKELFKIDKKYTFIFIWFIVGLIGARTAVRMLFFFAPITAVVAAYAFTHVYDWAKVQKKAARFITLIASGIFLFIIIGGFSATVLAQGQGIGAAYNYQWQKAMDWTSKNTPEDAVFAHWWDYGYYVQTGANRATISDGGNARGAINYFTGRYFLTAPNYTDALDFLYANEVSHVLIISEEIGKYGAFSSIGSDANYDRLSWINIFTQDPQKTMETRNTTVFGYFGVWGLDEDMTYQGITFPKQQAAIAAFFLPVQTTKDQEGNIIFGEIETPLAVTIYNNQRYDIPVDCIYIHGQGIKTFNVKEGHKGCLYVLPQFVTDTQVNPIGTAMYLSPRVRASRLAHLYLFGEETDNFKLVYSDDTEFPLSIYQGRLIGPLKIWQVTYPKDIKDNPVYRNQALPDPRVEKV